MVRSQAINGKEADPGGLSHLKQTMAMTAVRPPLIATLTQNQSGAGKASLFAWGANGNGWPTRGNPAIARRS